MIFLTKLGSEAAREDIWFEGSDYKYHQGYPNLSVGCVSWQVTTLFNTVAAEQIVKNLIIHDKIFSSRERRKSDADISDLTPDSSDATLSSRGYSLQ